MGVLQLFLFRAVTLIVFSHAISSSSASAAGFSCVKAGCRGAARVAAVRQELWMEPERLAAIPGEGAAPAVLPWSRPWASPLGGEWVRAGPSHVSPGNFLI